MEKYDFVLADLTNNSPLSILTNARFADYWEGMKADDGSDCIELIKLFGNKKSATIVVGVDRYTEDENGFISNSPNDTMHLYIEAWMLPDRDGPDKSDEPLAIEWIGEPNAVTEEDILLAFLSVFSRAEEYLASEDSN